MTNRWEPIRISVPRPEGAGDRKRKLGMGLNALYGETRREEPLAGGEQAADSGDTKTALRNVPISLIKPLPGQPRTHFDEGALEELAASIAARGLIQPVLVQPQEDGSFQLVAGERRWRAAQKAGLAEIPAVVRQLDQREVMALALIENLQRENLNPLEEARAYQKLAQDDGLTQLDLAKLVNKSRSHVANLLRLLTLPEEVQTLVEEGRLSMGHARALIGYERAGELAGRAVRENLSVRDVEEAVRQETHKPPRQQSGVRRDQQPNADIAAVEAHLQEFLGMTIRIKTDEGAKKGAVTIHYRTLDQLDLICQRLTGGDI